MQSNRRSFLVGSLSGCVGCTALLKAQSPASKHKFLKDSEMSFQQVYEFAYSRGLIPVMQELSAELGKEELLEMLKKAASKAAAEQTKRQAKELPNNDLSAWTTPLKNPDHFWENVLSWSIVGETESTFEVRVTECIWAKTFRDAQAEEIGYACICHPDFAMAPAFNPKMKMTRDKTLMQGDEYCNHRWVIKT